MADTADPERKKTGGRVLPSLHDPSQWPMRMTRPEVAYVMRYSIRTLVDRMASGRFPRPDDGKTWLRDMVERLAKGLIRDYERAAQGMLGAKPSSWETSDEERREDESPLADAEEEAAVHLGFNGLDGKPKMGRVVRLSRDAPNARRSIGLDVVSASAKLILDRCVEPGPERHSHTTLPSGPKE